MKRTVEKILIVAAILCNILAAAIGFIIITSINLIKDSAEFKQEFLNSFNEGEMQGVEPMTADELQSIIDAVTPVAGGVGWFFIILMIISTILGIIAFVYLGKVEKVKTAGILLIIAGVLAGIISITAIIFYIAAIMCFVRKERKQLEDFS